MLRFEFPITAIITKANSQNTQQLWIHSLGIVLNEPYRLAVKGLPYAKKELKTSVNSKILVRLTEVSLMSLQK